MPIKLKMDKPGGESTDKSNVDEGMPEENSAETSTTKNEQTVEDNPKAMLV
jgi:hypothetical protein